MGGGGGRNFDACCPSTGNHLGDELELGDGHLLAHVAQAGLQARLLGGGVGGAGPRLPAEGGHGEVVVGRQPLGGLTALQDRGLGLRV